MSKDRYTLLLKILHFCENNIENYDPIVKIHHILEKLKTSFKTAIYPYEKIQLFQTIYTDKKKQV